MEKMQEIRVQSLGREDSLEKEMATHSSILEEPGRLQSVGLQKVGHDWACTYTPGFDATPSTWNTDYQGAQLPRSGWSGGKWQLYLKASSGERANRKVTLTRLKLDGLFATEKAA